MTMTTVKYVPQKVLQQAATIAWITGLGAITAEALAVRDQLSTAVARERLDEAVKLGFLEQHSVLVGYSALYTATATGRRLASKHAHSGGYTHPKGLGACRVAIKDTRHTIACASVATTLERRYPDHLLIGERELHRDEREQGRRLASLEIRGRSGRRSHSPDLVMWPPATPEVQSPLPIAIEVELTYKENVMLKENCRAMARCSYIEAALYYAETTAIEKRLLEVIEELRAEDKIVVNPLSEILVALPGFDLAQEGEPTTNHSIK
jgi:hypothetical protein